ncbi:unnamed protein product [Merluccius merluccius]
MDITQPMRPRRGRPPDGDVRPRARAGRPPGDEMGAQPCRPQTHMGGPPRGRPGYPFKLERPLQQWRGTRSPTQASAAETPVDTQALGMGGAAAATNAQAASFGRGAVGKRQA